MSQQYGYAYPPAGAEPYPPPEDPAYAQGYYGAQSAAAPPAGGAPPGDQAQLIPGFPTPYAPAPGAAAPQAPPPGAAGTLPPYASAQYVPQEYAPPSTQHPQTTAFPNDPYGGYDAVNYPSIPALVEHARLGGFSSTNAAGSASYGGVSPSDTASRAGAARPAEEPGAPHGNARYRVMLLPTRDGGDIENVVAQVGLDGVAFLKPEWQGGGVLDGRSYAMEKITKWTLSDPTILMVTVVDETNGDGSRTTSLGISADAATCGAVADALVTAAFQWCELRGFDPATAVAEGSRAGEWVNHKANTGGDASGVNGDASSAARRDATNAPSVAYHERPEHCGWLAKKGERLQTWRRRWFVLKSGKLGWFKAPADVRAGAKPRGELDMASVASACTATVADAGRAHGVELIGSAAAEKAGCKFLLADSERECDQWAAALDAVINGAPASASEGGANERTSSSYAPAPASAFASQLRDGFERAAAGRGANSGAALSRDIEVSVAGYTSGAQTPGFGNPYGGGSSPAGGPFVGVSAPSNWETFYTNEGTPYFVNSATGVTQWETPPGVRVDM